MAALLHNIPIGRKHVAAAGARLFRLKMFPLFHICHCILTIEGVRADLAQNQQSGSEDFSRKHPVSCWLSSTLSCFAGSMIANAILGESVLSELRNNDAVLVASITWYMVFYFPFDLFHRFCQVKPVKLVLSMMREIQRLRKINDGVLHGMHVFPDGYLPIIFTGIAKGCGSQIFSFACRFIYGVWLPTNHELLQPSLTTKLCALISVLFLLQRKQILDVDKYVLSLVMLLTLILLKVLIIFGTTDSILTLDKFLADVFFGNWSNAFWRARRKAVWRDSVDARPALERVRSLEDDAANVAEQQEKSKKRD